jgi:phthalate 4,5-dioxygenase
MLSREDNEVLCRVEPGTPMNAAFKRYWLPAALISDHPEPDSDPKRVTILCEDYVLFRDSNGDMACMQDRCCHRGASLTLGRVEECGIRCIFHGWKFDKSGAIVDLPNSTDDTYKNRYKQPAFPTYEAGGMVWVYLGPKEEQPPVPDYYWLDWTPEKYFIQPVVFDANFSQVIDGGADSSHLTILHQDALSRDTAGGGQDVRNRVLADAAPVFDSQETEFGQFSVAIRTTPDEDGNPITTARTSAFIAPSTVYVTFGTKTSGNWGVIVPVTSTRSIFWIGVFNDVFKGHDAKTLMHYLSIDDETLDKLGNSRAMCDRPDKASSRNNWMQDRAAMKAGERFTGLHLFIPEDIAVAESMGSIFDRGEENLVPADLAIVKIRRILLGMARDVAEGRKPIGHRASPKTSSIFCQEIRLESEDNWRSVALPEAFR